MVKKITKAILKKREKRLNKRKFRETLDIWKKEIYVRDSYTCQICNRYLLDEIKHAHHIIALQSVKRKYPELLSNTNNGILLCSYCHKFAPYSPHQGGFEFAIWLEKNKPMQYILLKNFAIEKIY